MKLRETAIQKEFRGEEVTVEIEALVCPKCGARSIAGDKIGLYGKLLVEAYQQKKGLLTGTEIRQRRERLGMSQEAFAKWVKVGIASVKRWELGAVQDEAMDELLRVKTDPVAAKANYEAVCGRAGVEAAVSRTVFVAVRPQPAHSYLDPAAGGALRRRLERGRKAAAERLTGIQVV
jgi:putative zinc finger/helix-turn-helix YgiT family protein